MEIQVILLSFVAAITILMLIHDYFTSILFNQTYYLSDSILFKIPIVLFFIPIFIFGHISNFKFSREINALKLMIYLIPIVIGHILVASWLITFIAQTFLDSPITFRHLIQSKFNQDLIFLLTIYGMMFLIARYHALKYKLKKPKPIESLSIKQGATTKIIAVDDIEWIAAETPYIGIWIKNKKHLYPSTLSNIITKLNNDNFIRIHKSTIVNKSKILSIHSRSNGDYDIKLDDNTLLRLSRSYRNKFQTRFK